MGCFYLCIRVLVKLHERISYTSHAFDLYRRDAASLARLTEAVNFTATISDRNRSYYSSILPADAVPKVEIVHCGVDLKKFTAIGPGNGPLLSVGRLVPKKGFNFLIEAVAELVSRGIDVHCRIIGEGPQRQELTELIAHHRLERQVELAGPQPPDKVLEALTNATAFVLPCIEAADGDVDGIPVSLMEAMAMEKVVVTTDISGITELVDNGVNGILVGQGETTALADVLAKLLAKEVDVAEMGQRARATVQAEFDCRANARRLVSLIEKQQRG